MNEIIIAVLAGVVFVNLMLSVIIFSRGMHSLLNVLFSLLSFSVGAWSLAIMGFYFVDAPFKFNWVALTHALAALIPLIFFYYCNIFPTPIIKNKQVLVIASLPFLGIIYLLFSGTYIIGDTKGFVYELNQGYTYYQIILCSYFIASFVLLFIQLLRQSDADRRKQIRLILFGAVFSSSLAMITDLVFPFIDIFEYTWVGPAFTLILVFSIFFAILKHHLFDIKVIVTEITVIIIISVLLVDVFFSSDYKGLFIRGSVLILISIFSFILIRGVYKEVSQREKIQKMADDLAHANDRLTELDKLKSEFVSLATHQIRGPLAAIKGYASLMLEGDYGVVPRGLEKPIETVFESSKSLAVIVDDFLNVSRIEQGKMKYDYTVFDLCTLINESSSELKPTVIKKGLELHVALCEEPVMVRADIGKIKQVINNVIDNSIKYTPEGYIKISIQSDKDERKVVVRVSDTGVGIRAETIPYLFKKFSRAEDASKVNILGTGLGLYVAKQMIEAQGGKIWVESQGEGKGSDFYIELKRV